MPKYNARKEGPVTSDKPNVPSGLNADETVAWVADDPERAQAALEVEQDSDSPRSTVTGKVEKVAAAGDEDTNDEKQNQRQDRTTAKKTD